MAHYTYCSRNMHPDNKKRRIEQMDRFVQIAAWICWNARARGFPYSHVHAAKEARNCFTYYSFLLSFIIRSGNQISQRALFPRVENRRMIRNTDGNCRACCTRCLAVIDKSLRPLRSLSLTRNTTMSIINRRRKR